MATPTKTEVITIDPIQTETIRVAVRGTAPLICNRLAEKAKHELLLPKGRKTAAERASSLKHDPITEFRASPYIIDDDDAATLIAGLSSWFKRAMEGAALRIPNAKKSEIKSLVHVENYYTAIYGLPEIFSSITRSADMNRTPDVRTRAILPEWAAVLDVRFTIPILTQRSILNLLSAAGQINGVGDWRIEKGGWCGSFVITDPEEDEAFKRIVATGGRAAQQAAMDDPVAYNVETDELLAWFDAELEDRGRKVTKIAKVA
jgi:hypothetical protein